MTKLAVRRHVVELALVLFAVLLYANSAGNGFVLDDGSIIVKNPLIQSLKNIPMLFASDYWDPTVKSGLYRPLVTLSYTVNYFFAGLKATSYHLVNIILHAMNSLLVLVLFRRLTADDFVSAAGAFFFAAHAVHTEAVANIVGRAELFSALFFLGSLLLYIRARGDKGASGRAFYFASLAAYLLALLSKENAITLLGVLFLYDLTYGEEPKQTFWKNVVRVAKGRFRGFYLGFLLITALYLAARFFVIHSVQPITEFDNPLVTLGPPLRILNALQVGYRYLWLLLFPLHLSYDYSYNQLPIYQSFLEPVSLFTLGLTLLLLWLFIRSYRRSMELFFAIGFTVIAFSIVSNIVVPIGTIMGERLLYLPSVGFCLAVSIGLRRTFGHLRLQERSVISILIGLMIVIVGLNGWRTVLRNRDWASDTKLFLHDLTVSPRSFKVQQNAGTMLWADLRRYEDALKAFQRAIKIVPRKISYAYMAHTLINLGREKEAIAIYDKLVRGGYQDWRVHNNLGYLLVERGIDTKRGVLLLENIAKKYPKEPNILDSLGWAYYKIGRVREAYDLVKQSLELEDPRQSSKTRRAHLNEIERALKTLAPKPGGNPP